MSLLHMWIDVWKREEKNWKEGLRGQKWPWKQNPSMTQKLKVQQKSQNTP